MGVLLTSGSVIFTLTLFISTLQGIRCAYNATANQFPYHVYIQVLDNNFKEVAKCNGAIIAKEFIITSYRGRVFKLRLVSIYPRHEDDGPHVKLHVIERFYAPPDIIMSNASTLNNFVAVLRMGAPIEFNAYINMVDIPTPEDETSSLVTIPPPNYFANITGYYSTGGEHLQWLNMRVVNMSECADHHFDEDLLQYALCVRGEDKDGSLCRDANVPLVRDNILKQSNAHCEEGGPNLFINVQHFSKWITDTIDKINSGITKHNATKNEFRYHAHIQMFNTDNNNFNNYSGAVITSKLIITTEYCTRDAKDFRIRLGFLNNREADDIPEYDEMMRADYFVSPSRNDSEMLPALLQLAKEIRFTNQIQPVQLPERDTNYGLSHYFAIASGFYLYYHYHLQWIYMKVVPNRTCDHKLEQEKGSICVQSDAEYDPDKFEYGSVCNDQGGPLVLNSDRKTLIGISSSFCETIVKIYYHL